MLVIDDSQVEDLKRIASMLGMSGYQPLIRFYTGKGLRESLIELQGAQWERLSAILLQRGMIDDQVAEIINEARNGAPEHRTSA